MDGNPFCEVARAFSPPDTSVRLRFGTVTSISPVTVDVGGLTITGETLYINPELLEREQEADFSFPGFHEESTSQTGTVTLKKPLEAGDRVLLYSDDDQVFYILCRMVST